MGDKCIKQIATVYYGSCMTPTENVSDVRGDKTTAPANRFTCDGLCRALRQPNPRSHKRRPQRPKHIAPNDTIASVSNHRAFRTCRITHTNDRHTRTSIAHKSRALRRHTANSSMSVQVRSGAHTPIEQHDSKRVRPDGRPGHGGRLHVRLVDDGAREYDSATT